MLIRDNLSELDCDMLQQMIDGRQVMKWSGRSTTVLEEGRKSQQEIEICFEDKNLNEDKSLSPKALPRGEEHTQGERVVHVKMMPTPAVVRKAPPICSERSGVLSWRSSELQVPLVKLPPCPAKRVPVAASAAREALAESWAVSGVADVAGEDERRQVMFDDWDAQIFSLRKRAKQIAEPKKAAAKRDICEVVKHRKIHGQPL